MVGEARVLVPAARRLGQAEVQHLEDVSFAVARQDEVLRLDVAVDHLLLEGVLQAQRRLSDVVAGVGDRQRTLPLDQPGEILSLDVLHGEGQHFARLDGAVGRDDVGVVEPGRRADLAQEALRRAGTIQQGLVHDFEHFQAVHELISGQVDDAHTAAAQFAKDFVLRVVG